MESIYSPLLELTRVDGTIRPYRYFNNHDDKVALGPREHSLKLQFRAESRMARVRDRPNLSTV